MNTGAIITAVGSVLTVVVTILLGWFVRRTDRAAKMTKANMADQEYILKLVGALRDDYWALDDSWYFLRGLATSWRNKLKALEHTDLELGEIPRKPEPAHRKLESRHARGEPLDDDEK